MARFTSLIAAFAALLALVSAAPIEKKTALHALEFPEFPKASGTGEAIASIADGTSSGGRFNTGDGDTGITGAGVGDDVSGASAGSAVTSGSGSLSVFAGPGEGSVEGDVEAA